MKQARCGIREGLLLISFPDLLIALTLILEVLTAFIPWWTNAKIEMPNDNFISKEPQVANIRDKMNKFNHNLLSFFACLALLLLPVATSTGYVFKQVKKNCHTEYETMTTYENSSV